MRLEMKPATAYSLHRVLFRVTHSRGDWTEGNPCRGIVIRQKSTSVLEPGDAQKDVVVRSEGSHTPQRAGAHLIDS